jgi:hypothetical protein
MMSEPWSKAPAAPYDPIDTDPAAGAAPLTARGLLEQMQELLASVSEDLAGMGAALQSAAATGSPRPVVAAEPSDAP